MVSCKVTTIENVDNRKIGGVGVILEVTGGVGVSAVYWGLAGTVGTQGSEGV